DRDLTLEPFSSGLCHLAASDQRMFWLCPSFMRRVLHLQDSTCRVAVHVAFEAMSNRRGSHDPRHLNAFRFWILEVDPSVEYLRLGVFLSFVEEFPFLKLIGKFVFDFAHPSSR